MSIYSWCKIIWKTYRQRTIISHWGELQAWKTIWIHLIRPSWAFKTTYLAEIIPKVNWTVDLTALTWKITSKMKLLSLKKSQNKGQINSLRRSLVWLKVPRISLKIAIYSRISPLRLLKSHIVIKIPEVK